MIDQDVEILFQVLKKTPCRQDIHTIEVALEKHGHKGIQLLARIAGVIQGLPTIAVQEQGNGRLGPLKNVTQLVDGVVSHFSELLADKVSGYDATRKTVLHYERRIEMFTL